MTTESKAARRWTVISIPGREDDGGDTAWFAYDRTARSSSRAFESYGAARDEARRLNATWAADGK